MSEADQTQGTILSVYVDGETLRRLRHAAVQLARPVEELAETCVAEAALDYAKSQQLNPL
jgi:hypothetical protein